MKLSAVEEARVGRFYQLSPCCSSSSWAQAMQNEPLGLDLMPMLGGDVAAKHGSRYVASHMTEVFVDKRDRCGGIGNRNPMNFLEKPNFAPKVVPSNSPKLRLPLPRNQEEFGPLLEFDLGTIPVSSSQPITAKTKEAEDATLQLHVTGTLKVVSAYQQKRSSFLPKNQLIAPTPNESNTDDKKLYSSSVTGNAIAAYTETQFHGVKSSTSVAPADISNADRLCPANASGTEHAVKPELKSRDQTLRFPNNEVKGLPDVNGPEGGRNNTKKHKTDGDSGAGDHVMKRRRLENKSIIARASGISDKFQAEIRIPGLEQVGSDATPDSSNNSGVLNGLGPNSMPKSVDPTFLFRLHQMEQQRLETKSLQSAATSECNGTNVSICNGLPGEVSSVNSILKSKKAAQNQPQLNCIPAQSAPTGSHKDNGRIRMKSRDPRQILHSSMVQKDENLSQQSTRHLTETVSAASARGSAESASESTGPWGDVGHLLDGCNHGPKEAIQRERSERISEQNKMFAARKLCLVLDLDHTLLNSAKFADVDPILEKVLRKKEEKDKGKTQQHLFRFRHMKMWTKLRPGIWNFLEKASNLFELHVYTMGSKSYATEIAKVLDPNGSLFAGRVFSKEPDKGHRPEGDEKVPKTKDLNGVQGLESAVVIIDDTSSVWPHNKHNLILVDKYTYFPSSRLQFGLQGPSLLQIDRDERPEDGTLATALAVIERIHQNFFSHHSIEHADVRCILAAEQRKVLAGCRIIFSRIFPVGEANPHLHPLWQTAEQFGAVCTNKIDERVTHVVANSLGTEKVNWALSTGRFVVHPSWVQTSGLLYRRAKEHDFAVKTSK